MVTYYLLGSYSSADKRDIMKSIHVTTDFFIIEDDRATIKLLLSYFESQGYSCNHAESVSTAFRMLDTTLPTIILLDIMLPDQNGYALVKPIKSNPRFKGVVIYFITVIDRSEALELVEKFGVDGLIMKPFSLEAFDPLFKILNEK